MRTLKFCVLLLCALFVSQLHAAQHSRMALSMDQRVAYQKAIEQVYWKHTIWPADNPQPKPALDAVMSQRDIRSKVEDYIRKSNALALYGHRPITGEQMQAEMDRMAKETKDSEVLQELYTALGNDPHVIAECLARPILVDRLSQGFDQRSQLSNQQESILIDTSAFLYKLPRISSSNTLEPSTLKTGTSDSWSRISTKGAPSARQLYTEVWTGTQLIVWGGRDDKGRGINTGGRYNLSTNSWSATSIRGAPSRRIHPAAGVWTGKEMIIWGGADVDNILKTGGRYNPLTDSWTATSIKHAPGARNAHTAIWTGTEMIVWGGDGPNDTYRKTGGRYNPSTNSWRATTTKGAPTGRDQHTAVWTGTEMIVWGGCCDSFGAFTTGGRYNPSTNSWTAIATSGERSSSNPQNPARDTHTAIWTGTEMIIWGGEDPFTGHRDYNTGFRYDPVTNSWRVTNTAGAPEKRSGQAAVWTGKEMIIWGGNTFAPPETRNPNYTGASYDPTTDSWLPTSTKGAPKAYYSDFFHDVNLVTFWTGKQMIVFGYTTKGARSGGRYTP